MRANGIEMSGGAAAPTTSVDENEKHCASSCELKREKFQIANKMDMVTLSRYAWDCCITISFLIGFPRTTN